MPTLEDIYEARRKNLNELIARLGGRGAVATIAKRIGHGWPGFVSQMRSAPDRYGHRKMTETTAREIELAFSLPVGSMDHYPLPPEGRSSPPVTPQRPPVGANDVLGALLAAADRAGVTLQPGKLGPALAAMDGSTDPARADAVVALMK